jgi:hypothetical protein
MWPPQLSTTAIYGQQGFEPARGVQQLQLAAMIAVMERRFHDEVTEPWVDGGALPRVGKRIHRRGATLDSTRGGCFYARSAATTASVTPFSGRAVGRCLIAAAGYSEAKWLTDHIETFNVMTVTN